jgi:peptidyl-prolyl cis-trans isomerase C
MLKISRLAALIVLGTLAASSALAAEQSAAVVNGVAIPQERVDLLVKSATLQGQADTPDLRKKVVDTLVTNELLAQEAVKKGLDKQSETIQELELAKENVLTGVFVQDYIKNHPITDATVNAEYKKLKESRGDKEFHLRHILVDSEKEAKDIAAKLKSKKETFEKLAAKSKDPGTKDHGGDLGWIPVGIIPTSFVKSFADAAMELKKGQISEPVKSQFGWHVIQLEDERDYKLPSVDELKPQITEYLEKQALKDAITDLRAKAKIE